MRVVCDNCGASYKIPETKLVKEVNKATCRKCGHRMLIRKAGDGDGATQQMDENPYLSTAGSEEFRSAIAAAAAGVPRVDNAARSEWEEEDPTHIAQLDDHGEPIPPPPPPVPRRGAASASLAGHSGPSAAVPSAAVPAAASPAASARPAPAPSPVSMPRPAAPVAPPAVAIHSPGPVAPAVPMPPSVAHSASPAPPAAAAFDPSGDLSLIGFGVVVAAVGGLLLAVADGGFLLRFAALFLALWGTLTSLFVVVTGSRGRRKASVVLSTVLGTLFAVVGSGAVIGAKSGADALSAFSSNLGELATAELATEAPAEAPAAPLGTLFAEEPAAEEPAAEEPAAEPVAELAPEPEPEPEPKAEPKAEPEPKAKEPGVDRDSAYVAPPSEPARSSSSSSSGSSSAKASTSTSSSSTSSSSKGSTASAPAEPATTGSSSKSAMSSLPPTVVDTMVKSNQAVKKCMYQEFKRSDGNLGSVTVRFKVLSSGKVSSASVISSRYKGTELDTCMTAALYTVTFPSFDGDAQSFDITLGT
jgi:predicted Zn finger-like uncharacterized protein